MIPANKQSAYSTAHSALHPSVLLDAFQLAAAAAVLFLSKFTFKSRRRLCSSACVSHRLWLCSWIFAFFCS